MSQQRTQWWVSYWPVVSAVVALGEIGVVVQFFRARAAYHYDVAHSGCYDECLGAWFGQLFWGAMIVMWPVLALITACALWLIYEGIKYLIGRTNGESRPGISRD